MSASLSLAEFYARVYAPRYLAEATPATVRQYAVAVRWWSRVVGSGVELGQVDAAAVARFEAALLGRGCRAATVKKHVWAVRAIVGAGRRDASGGAVER